MIPQPPLASKPRGRERDAQTLERNDSSILDSNILDSNRHDPNMLARMAGEQFVARERELAVLEEALASDKSELIPIYGRRRVGKTALISQFISGRPALYFQGRQLPREQQLRAFLEAAAATLGDELIAHAAVDDWLRALALVQERAPLEKARKLILALDEFQWIAASAPEITSSIQQLWDHQWQHGANIVLILCGSIVGFMEREVLGRKSPLFGRRTRTMHLGPLSAAEARQLHPRMSLEDAARTYMICGGIPAYEKAFSDKHSFTQNIASSFLDSGPLANEPAFLLREELRELPTYQGVLTAIAHGTSTRKDLAKVVGISETNLSFYLDQLVALGYVRRRYPLSERRPASRVVRFALADSLLAFWFRFIEETERQAALIGAARAVATQIVPELDSYLGTRFEEFCRQALPSLYAREQVTAAYEIGEYWSDGVQIDVVGLRRDGVIDVGECKWGPVRSQPALASELEAKISVFPNSAQATIVRRAFVRRAPRGRRSNELRVHTLAELYAAEEDVRPRLRKGRRRR